MEVKYLCLEHIFFRRPRRPLALALASKNLGLGLGLEPIRGGDQTGLTCYIKHEMTTAYIYFADIFKTSDKRFFIDSSSRA